PVTAVDPGALGDLLYLLLFGRLWRPGEGAGGLRELVDVERELVGDALERFPLQGLVVVRPRPEEERERPLERRSPQRVLVGRDRAELQRPPGREGHARRAQKARERDRQPEEEIRRQPVV